MKQFFPLFLAVLLICALTACGAPAPVSGGSSSSQSTIMGSISSQESNRSETAEVPSPEAPVQETVSAPSAPESQQAASPTAPASGGKTLIAYFSLWGNVNYPDGVDATTSASIVIDNSRFGTTEYVARMIQAETGGDLHLIQTVEQYPDDFQEVIAVNHEEMANGTLPKLTASSLELSEYDTVFLGYPIWATDAPQAILSFLDQYDLSGKTVIPFCTHDGYGAGSSYSTVREASGATTLEGLAIEAKDVPHAKATVSEWLDSIGISGGQDEPTVAGETAIKITIGDITLDGVLFDTALAQEIKEQFPLTISMSGFGGREYYGGVDFYPENLEGGQKTFENGHITYCEAHHNMAIFYAQTDDPILSVDVIPIGKVTSDLSVFDTLGSRETITFSLAE